MVEQGYVVHGHGHVMNQEVLQWAIDTFQRELRYHHHWTQRYRSHMSHRWELSNAHFWCLLRKIDTQPLLTIKANAKAMEGSLQRVTSLRAIHTVLKTSVTAL